jgi:hypothetical protein
MLLLKSPTYQPRTVIESDLPRISPAPASERPYAQIDLIGAERKSYHCTYADLLDVPTPEPTYRTLKDGSPGNVSYQSIPFAECADIVRDTWSSILGIEPTLETYALVAKSRTDGAPKQVLGRLVWRDPLLTNQGVGAAFRSSHDGSMTFQVAGPSLTSMVCTNGCFPRSSVLKAWKLKHTTTVGERAAAMVSEHASTCLPDLGELREQRGRWQTIPMGEDLFLALIGIMEGKRKGRKPIISPGTARGARSYYHAIQNGGSLAAEDSRYNEQADGSLLSGYEALSAALQRQAVRTAFNGYSRVSGMIDAFSNSGGSLEGLPEIRTLDITEFH